MTDTYSSASERIADMASYDIQSFYEQVVDTGTSYKLNPVWLIEKPRVS